MPKEAKVMPELLQTNLGGLSRLEVSELQLEKTRWVQKIKGGDG